MIHEFRIQGLEVRTGDILFTRDGEAGSLFGQLWGLLGKLIPGEVDHCLVYLGPGMRFVESGPRGVQVFEMPGEVWDPHPLLARRWILDTLAGAAYPLAGLDLHPGEAERVRLGVVDFCLEQAARSLPYNLDFFDPACDGAYYCSQLVYRAYLTQGIDLNTNQGVPSGVLAKVVFPQEIWNACPHQWVEQGPLTPGSPGEKSPGG